MQAKQVSALAILGTITGGIVAISQNPVALSFVTGFLANHPVLSGIAAFVSALGLLFHPQPK